MMLRACILILLMLLDVTPVAAQIVTSRDVSDVSVSIYRDPNRAEGAMDRRWPGGYAFISETRTIHIPAGSSVIRFEGVAEGLLPETAIITGLPRGVREKNRDARLISPAGLVDAYLKRRVVVSRTNPATGKPVKESAIIQAGPNGGVLLQTANGIEALRCSGLPERMLFPGIPQDLSAKPTLSVMTSSNQDVTVTVQLSYMAQGFDWSANYVATSAGEPDSLALFSWLTVANGGSQSFKNARLQVIAGKPNKEGAADPLETTSPALQLSCWPLDITSTHPETVWTRMDLPRGRDLSVYDRLGRNEEGTDRSSGLITVSGRLRKESLQDVPMAVMAISVSAPAPPPAPSPIIAQQEGLGDFKLYRVPMRVTVAAQSQKQVAMLNQPNAQFGKIYSANVARGAASPQQVPFVLRTRNVAARGLGLPLPAGSLALFEDVGGRHLLVGEHDLADHAIGEEVELALGQSPDVTWTLRRVSETDHRQGWRAEVTNARDVPISAEIIVPYDLASAQEGLERRRGGWALPISVPANDTAGITYILKQDTAP